MARNFVLLRLIAAAVVLVSSVFGLAAFIGALLLDLLRQLALPWPFSHVKDWLTTNPGLGPIGVDAFLGVAVLGVAAYLGYRLFTLLRRGALELGQDWGSNRTECRSASRLPRETSAAEAQAPPPAVRPGCEAGEEPPARTSH